MHSFKDFKVWQKAMELVSKVYEVTQSFPEVEKFGLTNQIRRSAVSIPSNIAEGCGRNSNKELSHFLSISLGSSYELETQLMIANNLNYLNSEDLIGFQKQLEEVQKMLFTLKMKYKA